MFIQRQDERAIEGRRIIGARSVAQVVVEPDNAARGISRHLFQDPEIIQLSPQLAKGLVEKVAARDGIERRKARSEDCLARPGTRGPACDGDSFDVSPTDSRSIQAELNCGARDAFDRSGPSELSFLDRSDDAAIVKKRRSRIMSHRR